MFLELLYSELSFREGFTKKKILTREYVSHSQINPCLKSIPVAGIDLRRGLKSIPDAGIESRLALKSILAGIIDFCAFIKKEKNNVFGEVEV